MNRAGVREAAAPAERSREYWRRVLLAGASTAIPRWTRRRESGTGRHETAIPGELVVSLRRLADELGVPFRSVLLTAHARVLGALSGDRDIVTGYALEGDLPPLPLRIRTGLPSWRTLVLEAHHAESELRSHARFALEGRGWEPGIRRPTLETILDPTGRAEGDLADGTLLRVSILQRDGVLLRMEYRRDVLDAAAARRIARYYLSALAWIAADPGAEHARQSLLSSEELRRQVHGLAGPRRTLPDRRAHEIFEERARARPDAVAAVHRGVEWTYRQLNGRANRLARALVARGLGREGVAAVVTERHLDWMAAVLAIFKAGGAYLPIEPGFPADRIARMLARAGCRLVLTERGSTGTLDHALESMPGVQALRMDEIPTEASDGVDLGIRVARGQLAYIFFTSGSTGEPKGVMCEHAGMLNHLCAKIQDFGIGEGDVVAQTASQCFDISVWQLVSALLAGGQTLLVEQEAILDAQRFIDRIVAGRVRVLQVVPSYLELLLSHLESNPRALPDLRCVSVTGEALQKKLVQRWFAIHPSIRLVNSYGLTETSDDTNHEVLAEAPVLERVPLGPPIQNVRAYVVDEHLSPVPLGAPGEIVFSGVCVGRGYVNDPERTKRAFMADPHTKGERLYRSGDYGRWLPDGKLEFLGRKDSQVKVNGFRIEIGEIEGALARQSGVRDAAVVVAGRAEHGRRLVAFYSGAEALDAGALRAGLRALLPQYMVPSAFRWMPRLPLTENGKVDRASLTAAAEAPDLPGPEHEGTAPATETWTPTERRLAGAWADVLGLPSARIGRRDHFFERGGTSLSAVRLVIAMERTLSLRDLIDHPVLLDLAAVIDQARDARPNGWSG